MPATFRRALATDLAALSAINTTVAASAAPDPIFAAIERHRAACAALAIIDEDTTPARYAAAEDEICASADALFATPPTSIAGAKALATFVIEDAEADGVESRCLDALKVLRSILDRVAALSA